MKRILFLGLVVIVAVSLWSAAYGTDNGKATGRVITGSAQAITKAALPNIADRSVDFDGNGTIDYQILTRILVTKYTGLMEGYATGLIQSAEDLATNTARAFLTGTFWGTVGGSEPGAMTFINTLVTDRSNPALWVITTRAVVVEGSGSGGLEGISGYGAYTLSGPPNGPFVGDSTWTFRFSNASGTAFLASP